MHEASFNDRLRYAFDNFMSRGTIALIAGLAVVSLAIIFAVALVSTILGVGPADEPGTSFAEALWLSLLRTLDPGTMGGDEGRRFRFLMLLVTIGGIFVISTLIGVLNNGIGDKLESLRKGRSRVVESGHTLILGWSEQVFPIVSELLVANENQHRPCIVILGDRDKVEMEEAIAAKVGPTGNTRVVCRSGDPIDLGDIEIGSPHTAKSILILAPPAEDPDASVIKTMLAITNNPNRRPEPYHVVAELRDLKNLEVAQIVGKDEVELILVGDLISRIVAQTCRQSGLSVVYNELLDFEGDEIYFVEEASLVGNTFGDALLSYRTSAVIGLHPQGGVPRLMPPFDTIIAKGDRLILLAADDDAAHVAPIPALPPATPRPTPSAAPGPERCLLLGWNWRAPSILRELSHYVAPGSSVVVVSDRDDAAAMADAAGVDDNLAVKCIAGDITDRRLLDSLEVTIFDHIIVLSYSDDLNPQRADAHTLMTLLHLRDIGDRAGVELGIVSEMLDLRNRALAEVTRADDFIVSDRLISLMMAQVAENKHLNAVFADIFDEQGAEIYLKPATDYVAPGKPTDFYAVTATARARGEIAIGYRIKALARDASLAYGVKVNPDKAETLTLAPGDSVIVVAEG